MLDIRIIIYIAIFHDFPTCQDTASVSFVGCVCVFNFLSSNHATRITMVDHDTHIGPSLPFSIFHLISSHFTPFYLISIIFQSHVLPISSPFTSQIFQVPVASASNGRLPCSCSVAPATVAVATTWWRSAQRWHAAAGRGSWTPPWCSWSRRNSCAWGSLGCPDQDAEALKSRMR